MNLYWINIVILIAATVIILLPITKLRWAVFAFLVVAQLEMSGRDFASASMVGPENTWKSIVLPTLLLLRTRFWGLKYVQFNGIIKYWVLFVVLVAVSVLWSPFKLSGLKQVGYLYTYSVTFLVFLYVWNHDSKGLLKIVVYSCIVSVIWAIIKTLLVHGSIFDTRVTTFANPQSFALFLVLNLSAIIFMGRREGVKYLKIVIPFVFFGVILTGSRTGFVSLIIFSMASIVFWVYEGKKIGRFAMLSFLMGGLVSVLIFLNSVFGYTINDIAKRHRVLTILQLVDNKGIDQISTGVWRLGMYDHIVQRFLYKHSLREKIFGKGTSSVAEIIVSGEYWYRDYTKNNVDANRLAHNEFLRALYEWGLIGFLVFLSLWVSVFGALRKNIKKYKTYEYRVLVLGFVIVLLFMSVENVLAVSASPAGLAISLLVVLLYHSNRSLNAKP
ncbi:MAG: O-antigen ligase domain-containing protein [Gammaproteobacteria bacterium]|nr:MAG: O-antigen ligase domain-containing protein [Gammaproteobacteria bacterium]